MRRLTQLKVKSLIKVTFRSILKQVGTWIQWQTFQWTEHIKFVTRRIPWRIFKISFQNKQKFKMASIDYKGKKRWQPASCVNKYS